MEIEMSADSRYQKIIRIIIIFVSLYAVALHVAEFTFYTMPSIKFFAYHVMVALVLIFLWFPIERNRNDAESKALFVFRALDWILIILSIVSSLYVIINYDSYINDMQNSVVSNDMIYFFGLVLTILILEATRRTLGKALPIIALVAIAYALLAHLIPGIFGNRQLSLRRIVFALFSDRGIYGTPTGTCANNVFLFLMFASFLNASGADKIFQDFALAIAGGRRGGPAKMAVIGSCLFGTISGSCVANVVSTGAFTIPLMKRSGYSAATAGAVESVASTGGQIMPPVMGAAAFVMSDIAGIPYAAICAGAIIPALMYYVCLFKMVDLEAVKYQIQGIKKEEIPDLRISLKRSLKLFIPVIILLVLLLGFGQTPMVAAICATLAIILCGILSPVERMKGSAVIDGCVKSGKSLCSVMSACATAGIVVGIFSLTGLGLKFSNLILQLGGSSVIISLILSMFVCIILGMGLPTTAAYIVCATVVAPALTSLGIPLFATHLFLLFFSSLSAITPPVAVASYAAAGIAKENPLKVGWTSFKLGITGFILPFAFVYNPEYLSFGVNLVTLLTLACGIVTSYSLAIAVQGYVEKKISVFFRIIYFVIGIAVVMPYKKFSLVLVIVFSVLYFAQKKIADKARPKESENSGLENS